MRAAEKTMLPKGMLVSVKGVRARIEFRIVRGEPLGEYSLYREDGGGRFTACICQIHLLEEIETARERLEERDRRLGLMRATEET